MAWVGVSLVLILAGGVSLVRWGIGWGSTSEERSRDMPGDDYLRDGPAVRVAMTRAVAIEAPPEQVWPWIAQLGRGAGWYSVDWLDNGRKVSAQHIVSWIPEPRPGDATAIGYLRDVDVGRSLTWWVDGVRFAGATTRLVTAFCLYENGSRTRLVSRMSADATGTMAPVALLVFRIIDSIMACSQLRGIRSRVERGEEYRRRSFEAETGDRTQYQLYEALYASGETAGVKGKEHAARWRQAAIEDGILPAGGPPLER